VKVVHLSFVPRFRAPLHLHKINALHFSEETKKDLTAKYATATISLFLSLRK
jgi:hypothetical protein